MSDKDFTPYEASHRIRPLLFVVTIVNHGQGEAIAQLCLSNEAYFAVLHYGKGTAPKEFYAFSASAIPKKEVVISIMREEKWLVYKNQLRERFSISEMSKGLGFAVPLDAVAGVSIYKMLANIRQFEKPRPGKGKEKKKHGQ